MLLLFKLPLSELVELAPLPGVLRLAMAPPPCACGATSSRMLDNSDVDDPRFRRRFAAMALGRSFPRPLDGPSIVEFSDGLVLICGVDLLVKRNSEVLWQPETPPLCHHHLLVGAKSCQHRSCRGASSCELKAGVQSSRMQKSEK